ncbi:flagellar motor stator protein MotA [Thermosyntropha sp.]|uniref:flagellar motor stator protein MotA n=1 Tax=Thermosyntropha sp. TaxID=2740820 RepID=UPI0025F3EEC0|nr:flagellar motor stator protein MotA [Thermosyntropha sp.]
MIAKGANIAILINPAAIIIIFVGTTAAIFNAFPMKEIKRIPALFKIIFTEPKRQDPAEAVKLIVELAQQARKEGLLSLEARLTEIEDPFIRKGLQLIVDGQDEQFLRDYLETEIATMSERHQSGALIFSQAGSYAPTLGVMGAVVGLIGALGHLDDTHKLGASISAAFVATLFGIFSGYVLWHPFATKLKRKSEEEVILKTMLVEGLVSLQSGNNPIQIKEKMMVFLTPEERSKLEEE